MDVVNAEAQLNNLLERRARERKEANFEEMAWKASVRKHNAKLRRQHRAEWFCYFSALADSLRRSAEEFERKAEALLDDDERRPTLAKHRDVCPAEGRGEGER